MIRVVVGEDKYIAREGISHALAEEADIEVVATCADLPSLRAAVADKRPDVVFVVAHSRGGSARRASNTTPAPPAVELRRSIDTREREAL